MGKDGDIRMRYFAVSVDGFVMRLVRMLVRLLGVLKCLPGALVARLMILFFVGLSGNKMRMSGASVHLRATLMMLVA